MRLPQDRILHIDTEIMDGKVNITAEWRGELVRCKYCDWWEKSDNSLQGRCERYGFYPTGEYYCAGAELKRDHEYERAIDQVSHDMRYEPTFNPDDGSM